MAVLFCRVITQEKGSGAIKNSRFIASSLFFSFVEQRRWGLTPEFLLKVSNDFFEFTRTSKHDVSCGKEEEGACLTD